MPILIIAEENTYQAVCFGKLCASCQCVYCTVDIVGVVHEDLGGFKILSSAREVVYSDDQQRTRRGPMEMY